ncbi:hypothetical protein [[Phormidium ambiguum] IAM M-71]|uniref:hypothetical protein n=1 Tax=[Phormidium ambiguum] IAM M-71 TaxID=454136 RepID=UPI0009FC6D18|nr:hypothetical protein [Phormidium ambiguum]
MYITKSNHEDTAPLNELLRLSNQTNEQISQNSHSQKLYQKDSKNRKTTEKEYTRFVNHAIPLSSLTEKDLEALAAMFDPEDLAEVEAELSHYLNLMCPEPCWEEDPFDFLRDYL